MLRRGFLLPLMLGTSAFSPDAFIRVSRSAVQPVQKIDAAAACSLSGYMQLPVEQYCGIELPMQAKLTPASEVWPTRSGSNEFALRVPPLRFSIPGVPLVVEPLVFALVQTRPDCVQISSDECTLSGSPFMESLRLNERFTFRVRTQLTWDDSETPAMRADTRIEADVETPSLFALVPRNLLERIAASAMSLVLHQLQSTFLRNLAADYARWATDESYREARRAQPGVR
eukprot:CAMPEP_0119315288 /NCGR_PEP_ID=MMETSP1333-20130426/35184_1 /TAXON_ID=418940 /ORGANISM="Scyphosphaera apsteinii, Strain RCC1455" /LENGTH=228 /DNA_ID=CAMNT_0007320599 /DNA_START=228 /DNA_END=914 /DNA_ORIENTATION=+